jgi:sulfate transport system substrate-binding protein
MKLNSRKWPQIFALGVSVTTACLSFVVPASAATTNVNVVGYSVVGPAYKALEAAFEATPAGSNVTFTNTFGASDTVTNNVANGQAADLVNLSYQSNVQTLVNDQLVPSNWTSQELNQGGVNPTLTGKRQQTTYNAPGIVTDSTVVFITRAGNPLGIKTWSDLTKSGVQIVTPNPATSGSAKWNLLAGYAGWLALKHTPAQSQNYLKSLIKNTIAQPTSGSAALSTFLAGTGNVLLDYEDDALAAFNANDPISIVVPPTTILIQNPIALTNTGITNSGATAFYKYLFSAAGQGIFASLGYRSVLKNVWNQTSANFAPFKKATDIVTVNELNKKGWAGLDPEFFGSTITFPKKDKVHPNAGIVTYLEQFAGQTA